MHINYLVVCLGTFLAIVFSIIYYILLNKYVVDARKSAAIKIQASAIDVRTKTSPIKILIEFLRTFIFGTVVSYACILLSVDTPQQALLLTFWLWLGFPVVIFTGTVLYENMPSRIAMIRAGDWLGRIFIFAMITAIWQ